MRVSSWPSTVLALATVGLWSCGRSHDFKELVSPVAGTIIIDGKPAEGVHVAAKPKVPDAENPTYTSAISDARGKFELQTYNPGDGVPPGEYRLTFRWPTKGRKPVDRLRGRYISVENSVKTFKVAEDPLDLGRIELSTK